MQRPPNGTQPNTRRCLFADCDKSAVRGLAYCRTHTNTAEAKHLHNALRSMAESIEDMPLGGPTDDPRNSPDSTRDDMSPSPKSGRGVGVRAERGRDNDDTTDLTRRQFAAELMQEQRERSRRFAQRSKRGKFSSLLEPAIAKIVDQAAEQESFDQEIGLLRFAMVRSVSEEVSANTMNLGVARAANAIAKLHIARFANLAARPVHKYGVAWDPPLKSESLVHYVWRHRPADFEERYLAKIEGDPQELPVSLDHSVELDHHHMGRRREDNVDDEGRYLPLQTNDNAAQARAEREARERPIHYEPQPDPEHPAGT